MSTLRGARVEAAFLDLIHDRPWVRYTVAVLEIVTAVGAFGGGIEMLRHPSTAFGTTTALISGSPFSTFTWPGVLLITLAGVVPLVLAIGTLARTRGALLLSAAWGVGMMAWIVTQWFLLSDFLWLQPVFFLVGAVVTGVSSFGLTRGMR